MICASYDNNMPTFEVFLSLFFLFHFSYACFQKTIHLSLSMRKAFFSVHLRSYTRKKLFSLYTHALKNSFSLYWHGLYKIFIPFQKFLFPFSIYTRCLYKNFLNIHSLLIYKNFFSHIVYIEKFIFFSLYTDMTFCSQRLFLSLFLALLRRLFVLFLDDAPKRKLYTVPEFQKILLTITNKH